MAKIDRRKSYYMVFDTETSNGLDDPIVYDIGFAIVDKKGNVYEAKSFVIYETFCKMKDLMQSAYYADKIPNYIEQIEKVCSNHFTFYLARYCHCIFSFLYFLQILYTK